MLKLERCGTVEQRGGMVHPSASSVYEGIWGVLGVSIIQAFPLSFPCPEIARIRVAQATVRSL